MPSCSCWMTQHEQIRTSRLQTQVVVPSTLSLDRPLGDPLANLCIAPERLLSPFPQSFFSHLAFFWIRWPEFFIYRVQSNSFQSSPPESLDTALLVLVTAPSLPSTGFSFPPLSQCFAWVARGNRLSWCERSGPEAARTILLFHVIRARPSKQPLMVRTFLKVYTDLGSYFLFLQGQIKDIIIIN